MTKMFSKNTSLENLDLSGFNTDKLVDISDMFTMCTNLKNINFKNWHPKLRGTVGTFWRCVKLESLDLSGFDVSKSTNFMNMFYENKALKKLNISTWKPSNVSNVNYLFTSLNNIDEIDMSGFTTFTSNYEHTQIFNLINKDVVIKTGNETFKNDMKALYPDLNIE